MQRTNYSAPALDILMDDASLLLSAYQQRRPNSDNLNRIRLIKELDIIHQRIRALRGSSSFGVSYTDEMLLKVSLGAWIYALESVDSEYFNRDALPKRGYFYNTGSVLCELITNTLEVSSANILDDQTRLICLAEFHQFAAQQESQLQFSDAVDDIDNIDFQDHIERAMANVLGRMMKSVKKLMHAIPTEEVLHEQFENLFENYKSKRLIRQPFYAPQVDEDRPFCAQLGQIVAALLKAEKKSSDPEQMDRGYKILLGLLIYMMRTIPGERSELFKICKSILNGGVDTLSPNVQFDCLMTLKTFLKDHSTIQRITDKGKQVFGGENRLVNLDTKLDMVRIQLEQQLAKLCPDQTHSMAGAKVLGTAAALTLYPVGYGVGSVLGAVGAGAESHANARLKIFMTDWFNQNAHYLLGLRGNGVGYIATTPIVTAVYQTIAGNLFGAVFALTGGMVMGGVGYLVVDLLLRNLYAYAVQNIKGNYKDPLYAGNFNPELLRCLEHLPMSVLSDKKKDKIGSVVGHERKLRLYAAPSDQSDAEQPDEDANRLLVQAP